MLNSHKKLEDLMRNPKYDLEKIRVWFIDRGAENDRNFAWGNDITPDAYYFKTATSDGYEPIPYHRILMISYENEIVFENIKLNGNGIHILRGEM